MWEDLVKSLLRFLVTSPKQTYIHPHLACFPCLRFSPGGKRYLLFLRTSLIPLRTTLNQKKDWNKQSYNPAEQCSVMHLSLLGEVWLDDSSAGSTAESLVLTDESVCLEGDSVRSLSSLVFSSELALVSLLSAAFSGADPASAPAVCWGWNRHGQTEKVKRCLSLTKASAGGGAMSLVKCGEPQQDEQDNKVMGSWRKKGLTSCSDSFLASCSAVPLSSAGPNRDSVFSAVHKRTSQKLCFSEYELFLNSHK